MFDISAYLSRINYSGSTDPTVETLRALHRVHLFTVPFENLDISLGRKIVLDEAAILNKVVILRRGGFCYELNCAFAALLRALNFQVTLLSARVSRANGGEGPEFDHLSLRVDLDEPRLVDVGFGDSFLEPLLLKPEMKQVDPAGTFRLIAYADRFRMERVGVDNAWKPEYSFSLLPRRLEEFAGMCQYHQTSPDSSFTRHRTCSRATPEGRMTLADMRFIVTSQGQRKEKELKSEEKRVRILWEDFGIRV